MLTLFLFISGYGVGWAFRNHDHTNASLIFFACYAATIIGSLKGGYDIGRDEE